ncbi:MAG TPA: cation transporter [Chthoniobacterales bacterium]|nr:cation transporter [Chthoniobacterales bacterium]
MSVDLAETLAVHRRTGRKIEFLSIGWTALESIVGIFAGVLAGSVALISFGIDSVIEVVSSLVLVWRLSDSAAAEDREEFAHRLVGICFLALAVYVSFEALKDLLTHSSPRVTYLGIIYAVACVIVMPVLARAKRRAAANLQSDALHADSHQSDICAYLAVILLGGLGLNALFGWWWADPVAALCMVPIILREAISGLRGESCTHEHRA